MIIPYNIRPFLFEFEAWAPITENIVANIQPWYYVSTHGRFYSTISNRFLNPTLDKNGYLVITLHRKDSTHIQKRTHRLVMLVFNYVDNHKDYQVNHINGFKSHNYKRNLEWCTASENVIHAFNTGLKVPQMGENNPSAVITNIQADEIGRLLSLQKYSHVQIASMMNCTPAIVEFINNGYTWKWVYDKYNLKDRRESRVLSNQQLHHICKFFEDNHKNMSRNELFINSLKGIGIEFTESFRKTMERIYHKKRFTNITSLYNY